MPTVSVAVAQGTFTSALNSTALTNAITAATTNMGTAVVSADGSDVLPANKWVLQADMTANTTAIAAAQAVVTNASATQADVDNAVTTLGTATTAFNSAKKVGTEVVVGDSGSLILAANDTSVTEIQLSGDIELDADLVVDSGPKAINLNGKTLTVSGGITINSDNSNITNGTISGSTIVNGMGSAAKFENVAFDSDLTNQDTGRNYTNSTFKAITNTVGNSTYTGTLDGAIINTAGNSTYTGPITGAVTNTAGDSTYNGNIGGAVTNTAGNSTYNGTIGGAVIHTSGTANYNVGTTYGAIGGALTVTAGIATFTCTINEIIGAVSIDSKATAIFNGGLT